MLACNSIAISVQIVFVRADNGDRAFDVFRPVAAPARAIDIAGDRNARFVVLCSGPDRAARKLTCLGDGDTGWEVGVRQSTPRNAECREEPEIAKGATFRMIKLMRGGYRIERIGERGSADREVVQVTLDDGRDAGQVLINEELAVEWPHPPRVWCDRPASRSVGSEVRCMSCSGCWSRAISPTLSS